MDAVMRTGSPATETAEESGSLDMGALQEHAPGTARVRAMAVRSHETLLTLAYPGGREIVVTLGGVPQRDEDPKPHGLIRPLAVLIRSRHAQVDCSVLGTSKQGPSRVAISVEQALALCGEGVHTVLRHES